MQRPLASSEPIYPYRSPTSANAWVDVDLGAVRRNAGRLRQAAGVPLVAMVKADSYGIGMLEVARALGATFAGVQTPTGSDESPWALGVATLDEAFALRQAGCTSRVMCTSPLLVRDLADALALGVRPALHTVETITAWADLGGAAWHLSIDTGMSRAGVRWDEVAPLASVIRAHPAEGVFTHFHSAERNDGSREQQERLFAQAWQSLGDALPPGVLLHCDNSSAIAARRPSPGHLARPGIALYGSTEATALGLEQVVHLRARIIDLREVNTGESVSYGATYRVAGACRIATVAVGYAEGYRRALSNHGVALVHGQRVPVVGAVTMDMTMLDVTLLGEKCALGDTVTLIGRDAEECIWTDDVAAAGGLSPYELLVGLRLRAVRRYFESAGNIVFSERA